jgi:hypothetical protein
MSLPLVLAWHRWEVLKVRAISQLLTQRPESKSVEDVIRAIQEMEPVAMWTILGSTLAAVGSFVFPLERGLME